MKRQSELRRKITREGKRNYFSVEICWGPNFVGPAIATVDGKRVAPIPRSCKSKKW